MEHSPQPADESLFMDRPGERVTTAEFQELRDRHAAHLANQGMDPVQAMREGARQAYQIFVGSDPEQSRWGDILND